MVRVINKLGLVLISAVFLLLLYKDPFSDRTLIPNFEPYPDTFYYINPALNLVKGAGFNFSREGRIFNPNVPPLYSVSLIPVFLMKPDPRMAYYANVFLAIISLSFFLLIIKKISTNKLVIGLLLVLYITNYFIYFVPTIIMAENLTMTLFIASLYFLLSKISSKNAVVLAFLAIAIYSSKFSNITISGSIILIYLGRILLSKLSVRQKINQLILFLGTTMFFGSLLVAFLAIYRNYNIFTQIISNLSLIQNSIPKAGSVSVPTSKASWFGIQYIQKNLPYYLNSLIGAHNRFLWDYTPILPMLVSIGGIVGITFGLLSKKRRIVSITLFVFLITLIAFLSTFYTFDARYIYIAIPILIIGFELFINFWEEKIKSKNTWLLNGLIAIGIIIYLAMNFVRIKSQISLNLRYAETPWNYIAVLKMNEYFTADKIVNDQKPVLISALPPFLIDYYSNGNYTLLPLSYDQDFRGQDRPPVWGYQDYSNLIRLYQSYLEKGFNLYVSRAGLGNEGYTNRDFNNIVSELDTELVLAGCYSQCNIYSVKLKTPYAK